MRKKARTLSLVDAMALVAEMKPKTLVDYRKRLKHFPGLPFSPSRAYVDYPGWYAFSGNLPPLYETFEQAREAVIRLGIKSWPEYLARRHEDRRLPFDPKKTYAKGYLGIKAFTGQEDRLPYATFADASQAAIALGIKTASQYKVLKSEDPRLPACPWKVYNHDWVGWSAFLNHVEERRGRGKYKTYAEFEVALRALGITGQVNYKERYSEDAKLPANPDTLYTDEWPGWSEACGVSRHLNVCKTWQEAKLVAVQYRFTSRQEYMDGCGVDNRLPKYPASKYKGFPGFKDFLLPDDYYCLDDVRCAIKILFIKNGAEYQKATKVYPCLPRYPDRKFPSEWKGWPDACGFAGFYPYDELRELVLSHGCNTIKEYKSLIVKLQDRRMPGSPEEVYPEWKNAYSFFDKVAPYTFEFVQDELLGWVPSMRGWLEVVRSSNTKETSLCRFLRWFVGPYNLGATPYEFLTRSNIDIRPFRELLDGQVPRTVARILLRHVNEYLNDFLKREMTMEDEDTGELVRFGNANNPFATLEYEGGADAESRPGESTKPVLAYQFVERIKKWIVPDNAKTFSDLRDIHEFDADYVQVNAALVDQSDPDCVSRERDGKVFLWYPGHWMHAYALASVPARGRQIAYNDSGEADEYIADIVEGDVVWVKNEGALATKSLDEAFIQKMADSGWGMHFTSNKTGFNGEGYDVNWAPEDFIYWMVKLRKWQQKYNPIAAPCPWTECTRTNLNKLQLLRKGSNCFLFRAFGEQQPPEYSQRLAERLAAALYFTQPRGINLATFREGGSFSTLYRYDSKYTAHSLRVSLITAYVMEFGLPIEIIMKLAGHSSMVMSIYYVKIGTAGLRRRMEEAEKRALVNELYGCQDMIEQSRLDALPHQLVASSQEALESLRAGNAGSALFRDYGMCPYAASRCDDGGPLVGATQVRLPAPIGYLGAQNCTRCRHHITGPVFLGGMVSLWNEISLSLQLLSEKYLDFEAAIQGLREQVQTLEEQQYDLGEAGGTFDESECKRIGLAIRKLESEKEGTAKKMDVFLCDQQALTKLINDSKEILRKEAAKAAGDGRGGQLPLILQGEQELFTEIHETSLFQQLSEVCENATVYHSASADLAAPRRSQLLDRMALLNNITPVMCSLNDKEQLVLGNYVTSFLLQRLKGWERVNKVVEGRLLLADLSGSERISQDEFMQVMKMRPTLLGKFLPPDYVPVLEDAPKKIENEAGAIDEGAKKLTPSSPLSEGCLSDENNRKRSSRGKDG